METRHRKSVQKNLDELVGKVNNFDRVIEILYADGIINYEMKQIIMGKDSIELRKRELFELIPKRGPLAFNALIKCLFQTDNEYLAKLLKPNRIFNGTDAAPSVGGYAVAKPSQRYTMESHPRGAVLIINIEKFQTDEDIRLGSKTDVEQLKQLWENFGFVVSVRKNLSKMEFESVYTAFVRAETFKDVDCCIIFVLSHGKEVDQKSEHVQIKMHDGAYVNSHWMFQQLNANYVPHLINKPKLIFIGTCRGGAIDFGTDITSSIGIPTIQSDCTVKAPVFSDILIVYPCLPGTRSFRDIKLGAWFIQHLVEVFEKHAYQMDLLNMLQKVDRKLLKHSYRSNNPFQTVCHFSYGFKKTLYLNPLHKNN